MSFPSPPLKDDSREPQIPIRSSTPAPARPRRPSKARELFSSIPLPKWLSSSTRSRSSSTASARPLALERNISSPILIDQTLLNHPSFGSPSRTDSLLWRGSEIHNASSALGYTVGSSMQHSAPNLDYETLATPSPSPSPPLQAPFEPETDQEPSPSPPQMSTKLPMLVFSTHDDDLSWGDETRRSLEAASPRLESGCPSTGSHGGSPTSPPLCTPSITLQEPSPPSSVHAEPPSTPSQSDSSGSDVEGAVRVAVWRGSRAQATLHNSLRPALSFIKAGRVGDPTATLGYRASLRMAASMRRRKPKPAPPSFGNNVGSSAEPNKQPTDTSGSGRGRE
jgi:hypothetical protein